MNFEDFIKQKKVKRGEQDTQLAKSILETIKIDRKFLDKQKIDEFSSRRLMCNYYDVLRSIIEAIAALDGIKSYSHEAFTYYLKEKKKEENIANKFDRYRKIRNQLSYYGKTISTEDSKKNIAEIKLLLEILKKKYFKEVKHEI
jgi:hypothetical protein